jgi:hypothetical protein
MRAKEYDVLLMALDAGIEFGFNRAFKHIESTLNYDDTSRLKQCLVDALTSSVGEWFDFEEPAFED